MSHLRAIESMTTSESFSFVSTDAVDCSATTLTCRHSFSENSTKLPRDVVANKTVLREVSVQTCSHSLPPKEICFNANFHHMCLKARSILIWHVCSATRKPIKAPTPRLRD